MTGGPQLEDSASDASTPGTQPYPAAEHSKRCAELFARYNSGLVSEIAKFLGSETDARDVVQQAYVKLLALDRPGTVSFLAAYLSQTARNLARDQLRGRVRHARLDVVAQRDAPRMHPSPESELLVREGGAAVRRAISALPPRVRAAFVMRIYDQLSYPQIAERFTTQYDLSLDVRTLKRYVSSGWEYCERALKEAGEEIET